MKKKYQVIMPVALPLLLVLSVIMMLQNRVEQNQIYQGYLQKARQSAQNGVYTDAASAYEAAMAMHPTIETELELGQMYADIGDYDSVEDVYDELVESYPKDVRTYEFGIQTQMAQENIRGAYQVADACEERGLTNETIQSQMQGVRYAFDLAGDFQEVRSFNTQSGLAAVQEGENWGYIDSNGSRAVNYLYKQAGTFTGVGPVVDSDGEAYYIDQNGDKKITASFFLEKDPEFGKIEAFGVQSGGLVPAYNGNVWNYYDARTYEKRFGGYKEATAFSNGVAAVSEDGESWALISSEGTPITEFVYQQFLTNDQGAICSGGALLAQKDGRYCLLDTSGNSITDTVYEDARGFNANEPAAVKKEGRWIFLDSAGTETDLGDFEDLKSFSAGVAAAKQNGKWGYINTSGEWLIEPQFADAGPFCGKGSAFVKVPDGNWQLLLLTRFHHG